MCEILMLIFGVITLIRGRFTLTRGTEVRGWPARIIGIVLIAPWPLSIPLVMALAMIFAVLGKEVQSEEFQNAAYILGFAFIVVCFLLAIGIAKVYGKPIYNRRAQEDKEAREAPDHYREHFQAEVERIPQPDSADVTDQLPHSSPRPDDRIRD